jgi:hypothetical protein
MGGIINGACAGGTPSLSPVNGNENFCAAEGSDIKAGKHTIARRAFRNRFNPM